MVIDKIGVLRKKRVKPDVLKKVKVIVILVLFFVLGVLIVISSKIYFDKHNLLHVKELPIVLETDYFWGFIPLSVSENSVLNFSRLVPGQTHSIFLLVENPFDYSVRAVIKTKGNVRQFLYIKENNIYIPAREFRNVTITATIPQIEFKDAEKKTGKFNGTLYVMLYKS